MTTYMKPNSDRRLDILSDLIVLMDLYRLANGKLNLTCIQINHISKLSLKLWFVSNTFIQSLKIFYTKFEMKVVWSCLKVISNLKGGPQTKSAKNHSLNKVELKKKETHTHTKDTGSIDQSMRLF